MDEVWPGYYLIKIIFFACLYLKPFLWANKIIAELKSESHIKSVPSAATQSDSHMKTAIADPLTAGSPKTAQPVDSSPQVGTAMSQSLSSVSPAFAPEDVMSKDSRHVLTPSVSDTDLEAQQPQSPVNLHDLVFKPTNEMVFNGPFDDNNVTYHMSVVNNSKRRIAFAIKSNAIPRLYCVPPFGIIKPGVTQPITVTVQKFDYENTDVTRDRIAFDYVFCSAETEKFSHRLFGGNETRRRKNIFIKYNP